MMSIGILGVLALLAQVSPGRLAADAGAVAPPPCTKLERYDLVPDQGPFRPGAQPEGFKAILREELVGPGVDARVLMVRTASVSNQPEYAVSMTRATGVKAKVTLRRYRDNVWVAATMWLERRPELGKERWTSRGDQAAWAAVSRKFDTFEADIDDAAFDAIARIWSLMLERTRAKQYSRGRVHAHVAHYFQDRVRSGVASGRAEGSAAQRLIALGEALASYASGPPEARRPLGKQLVADAAALEATLKGLKECPAAD